MPGHLYSTCRQLLRFPEYLELVTKMLVQDSLDESAKAAICCRPPQSPAQSAVRSTWAACSAPTLPCHAIHCDLAGLSAGAKCSAVGGAGLASPMGNIWCVKPVQDSACTLCSAVGGPRLAGRRIWRVCRHWHAGKDEQQGCKRPLCELPCCPLVLLLTAAA